MDPRFHGVSWADEFLSARWTPQSVHPQDTRSSKLSAAFPPASQQSFPLSITHIAPFLGVCPQMDGVPGDDDLDRSPHPNDLVTAVDGNSNGRAAAAELDDAAESMVDIGDSGRRLNGPELDAPEFNTETDDLGQVREGGNHGSGVDVCRGHVAWMTSCWFGCWRLWLARFCRDLMRRGRIVGC